MRLINTATGIFKDFFDSQRPRYAILSHTWSHEELSYLDLLILTSEIPNTPQGAVQALLRRPARDSDAVRKVEICCKLARSRGYDWAWIDNCCIDKSSSAELSEAINSMWAWYRDAAECYVYLADVSITTNELQTNTEALNDFSRARWFTRGWTLQELLAPKNVVFCNNRWEIFATKAQIGKELSAITRIPLVFLDGTYDPADCKLCSVAMKMSWISRRETTRIEDMAYCMLGLFDVHMPLIYGEGRKAFMRLQLEIIRKIDDDSIYAWTAQVERSGLLATWPSAFVDSGNIVQLNFPEDHTPWLPPTMTSLGLEMRGRYQRNDPHQRAVDAQHGVHSISTALATGVLAPMVVHCGPHAPNGSPLTQHWGPRDRGKALLITLRRFGPIWQRVKCDRLEFVEYAMYDPGHLDAYTVYYVEQPGV